MDLKLQPNMSLKRVQCGDTITSFFDIMKANVGYPSSIERAEKHRMNSLVVAEIVKIISVSIETKRLIALLKEVLPSSDYGQQFKAVMEDSVLFQLEAQLGGPLQSGDMFAFYEAFIFPNPSYEQDAGIVIQPKYLLQTGPGSSAIVWYVGKQTKPIFSSSKLSKHTVNDLHSSEVNDEVDNSEIEGHETINRPNDFDKDMAEHGPNVDLKQLTFNISAFLIKVYPDPSINPFNLVSGYCVTGCKRCFLHTNVKWKDINLTTALCPNCKIRSPKIERELQLMFMVKLRVISVPNGRNLTVLASRHHAEKFLKCSVSEYMHTPATRQNTAKWLNTLYVLGREPGNIIPRMELTVSVIGNLTCLIDVAYK